MAKKIFKLSFRYSYSNNPLSVEPLRISCWAPFMASFSDLVSYYSPGSPIFVNFLCPVVGGKSHVCIRG